MRALVDASQSNGFYMLNMFLRSVLAALSLMAAGAAVAQWQWVDESGKKVYSDRPPPIAVPESDILKAPKGALRPNGDRSQAARALAADEPAAEASQEDQELKAKVEQIQAQEQQKAQDNSAAMAQSNAEIEKSNAAARKGNCERARNRLAQLEPGKRVMATDASGSVGFMSDATRASERQTAQDIMKANCS